MSRVMLHLYVTFTTVPINCSSYDFYSKDFKSNIQTNYGWFSMCSKLKHSCEPNLWLLGLNDSVALVAMRTIKKGEELTISYIEHFYDVTLVLTPFACRSHLRAARVFLATQHMCDCRVCLEDWDSTCEDNVIMTARQRAVFDKLNSIPDDSEGYRVCCAMLDEFPLRSLLHKTAYEAIRVVLNLVKCKKTGNKTYIVL